MNKSHIFFISRICTVCSNYNKNIFVGTRGVEGINKSHFVAAAYGMERMMGHADTPVRRIFNYASDNFANHLPIVYVQTVVGLDKTDGKIKCRGFILVLELAK